MSHFNLKPFSNSMIMLITVFLLPFAMLKAQEHEKPWLIKLDPDNNRDQLKSIKASANVVVSDGLTYNTTTVFHDAQRAVFHRVYPDKTMVMGIDGQYFWQFDGKTENEATDIVKTFVLGHQFHAQLLFFDKLYVEYKITPDVTFAGQKCFVATSKESKTINSLFFNNAGLPLGYTITLDTGFIITYVYDDWQKRGDYYVPLKVNIDDGNRKFEYNFTGLSWNSGRIDNFKAAYQSLTDKQKLMRQHRYIMDGHFFGETATMKSQQSNIMHMLNQGEIYEVQGNQPEGMIDKILTSRVYTVYDDLVVPEISISDDGTLGWVIAQLYAKGYRIDSDGNPTGDIEFTCAWVELYKKENGKWKLQGITSTFK